MNEPFKNQLFILHFAGGNTYSFEFLKKELPNFEIFSLELPGRGKRFREKLINDKQNAIDDYYYQIKKLRNNEPYLIYGHSMGATLGLSVTSKMEALGDPPLKLIVTGNAGPGVSTKNFLYHHLDNIRLKEELIKLGGIPPEISNNNELFEFFLPIIRADFECIEKDFFSEKGLKINTPLYVIMGSEEESSSQIQNWRNFVQNSFDFKILEGNHFFIYNHVKFLTTILNQEISKQIIF